MTQEEALAAGDAHGSALDRISAFQIGFSGNADQCAAINMDEIKKRQGDLPQFLSYDATALRPTATAPPSTRICSPN